MAVSSLMATLTAFSWSGHFHRENHSLDAVCAWPQPRRSPRLRCSSSPQGRSARVCVCVLVFFYDSMLLLFLFFFHFALSCLCLLLFLLHVVVFFLWGGEAQLGWLILPCLFLFVVGLDGDLSPPTKRKHPAVWVSKTHHLQSRRTVPTRGFCHRWNFPCRLLLPWPEANLALICSSPLPSPCGKMASIPKLLPPPKTRGILPLTKILTNTRRAPCDSNMGSHDLAT